MISINLSNKKGKRKQRQLKETTATIFQCDDGEECDDTDNVNIIKLSENEELELTAGHFKSLGCELAERGGDDDMRQALLHFESGLKLDPTNHLLWELKSQVFLYFDKLLPAIEAAEEAVRLAPSWAEGFVTLARAQREFGEIELALANMKMANKLDKVSVEIIQELNEIEDIVQRLLAARESYENGKQNLTDGNCASNSCGKTSHEAHANTPLPTCFTRLNVISIRTSPEVPTMTQSVDDEQS